MITDLRNKNPKILVIGDLMIDHYLWGNCERISPEAPVQIVDISKETAFLGGAGNVVRNLNALGAFVHVVSVIGDDASGAQIISMLKDLSVETDGVFIEKGRRTGKKSRIIASHQQIIRYDLETKENISQASQQQMISYVQKYLESFDSIIISDYGKGVLTESLTQSIIHLGKEKQIKVLVDPKGKDYRKYCGAYLLTPNKKEASIATGIDIVDDTSLFEVGMKLKKSCELEISIITLSEDGIAIFTDEMKKISTVAKEVYDVTGAGDTVIASLAFVLGCKKSIEEAVKFANTAAAVVVGKIGSATASFDEIEQLESSSHHRYASSHIKSREEMVALLANIHREDKKIVFTNGCFDILHIGHIKYLETAKSFGDILIVGLNTDFSVKRLKGNNRPINNESDRAYLLAALEVVDYVVLFHEDTPYSLIEAIQPDILVKGGDYKDKEVVGSDLAKEVRLVDFIDGKSTSQTISRILKDVKIDS